MDKDIQSINKGLHTDYNEEFQPEGTYRFALNAIYESLVGERAGIINERGNRTIIGLPTDIDDYTIIGSCLLDNDDKVIFLTNNDVSIVALHKHNNTYEELIRTKCLNFNTCYQVDCLFKLHNSCEYILYFTDGINKYKSININTLPEYYKSNHTDILGGIDPNIPDVNGDYGWECGLFNLSPDVINPDIHVDQILSQGNLRLGAYTFFVKLLDKNLNGTDWITFTNPVYITQPQYQDKIYNNNNGVLGSADINGYRYTSKSIKLLIENLDTRFTYYQIGIAEKTQGTDTVNNGYISSVVNIPDTGTDTFTLSTVDSTELLQQDPTIFTQRTTKINTVQAHTQIENRLILGNLESTVVDWTPFQQSSNNIQIEYFTYSKVTEDTECGDKTVWSATGDKALENIAPGADFTNYSDPKFLAYGKSLMRDEIYALGIIWELIDGSESPIFHIPGRPKFGGAGSYNDPNLVQSYTIDGFDYADYALNTVQFLGEVNGVGDDVITMTGHAFLDNEELTIHQAVTNEDDTVNEDTHFITDNWDDNLYKYTYGRLFDISCCDWIDFPNNGCNEFVERWQYYNTAIRRKDSNNWASGDTQTNLSNGKYTYEEGYRGIPGYYDTGGTYPEILDCNGIPIYPATYDIDPVTARAINIQMHNIRHHKMPDCSVEELFTTDGTPEPNFNPPLEGFTTTDAEGCVRLYNLGVTAHNVQVPAGFEDQVVGYYIVMSDRSNNKTVIDKGYMNMTDTSLYPKFVPGYSGASTVFEPDEIGNGKLKQNEFFMCPTEKDNDNFYRLTNAMEIHTPKSTYNESVDLPVDYLKLEHTYYGDLFFTTPVTPPSHVAIVGNIFKTGAVTVFNRNKPPRMLTARDKRDLWEFKYNIPIDGVEYGYYNTITWSRLFSNMEIDTEMFQQKFLLANHANTCRTILPDKDLLNAPIPTTGSYWFSGLNPSNSKLCTMEGPAWRYIADGYKVNIISNWAEVQNAPLDGANPLFMNIVEMFEISNNTSANTSEDSWSTTQACSDEGYSQNHSPYLYYVGLKSNVTPYTNLDDILYNKLHSFKIDPNMDAAPISGGDTFISRFQVDKTYYDKEPGTDSDSQFSTCASTIIGYVESEINSHYRHLNQGEVYHAFPWSSHRESTWTFWADIFIISDDETIDDNLNTQEKFYNYTLDYSSNNREYPRVSLPVTYDYCAECSEEFPHTILYSEISLSSQSFDNYKQFLANSQRTIPADTGEITDLFVKAADLFIHTENNLWRMSAAPQQLSTNGASNTIQVGQGEFLSLKPVKMFDTQEGYARGGCIDKFASVHCDNSYIWVDRNSQSIWKFDKGVNDISRLGMTRFFKNNIESDLDNQYLSFTNELYPNKGTACKANTGYRATWDPNHKRYIVTKHDYRLLDEVINNMNEQTDDPLINGQYYYNGDGFFFAEGNVLVPIDLLDKDIAENKSWTISYSLETNIWASFHSYLPNWLYNDSKTFYTYISDSTNDAYRNVWEHNFGPFQSYYDFKYDFVVDTIYKKDPYTEKTFDTLDYTSNVWLESSNDKHWIEVPFTTFDRVYLYNNNQVSNLLDIDVINLDPYARITYDVSRTKAHKNRNHWKISRFRDMSVNRLNLTEPMFTEDWVELDYQNQFNGTHGYIDKVINPAYIDINKDVYQQERFTDKYLGARLFFNPPEDYKITFNIQTGLKRIRL